MHIFFIVLWATCLTLRKRSLQRPFKISSCCLRSRDTMSSHVSIRKFPASFMAACWSIQWLRFLKNSWERERERSLVQDKHKGTEKQREKNTKRGLSEPTLKKKEEKQHDKMGNKLSNPWWGCKFKITMVIWQQQSIRSFKISAEPTKTILLKISNAWNMVNAHWVVAIIKPFPYRYDTFFIFSCWFRVSSATSSQDCKEATTEVYFSQLDRTSSSILLTLRTSMERLLHWVTTSRMNLRTPISPSSTGIIDKTSIHM